MDAPAGGEAPEDAGTGQGSGNGTENPRPRLVLGQEGVAGYASEGSGRGERLGGRSWGVGPLQPSGHAAGPPRSGLLAPGHPPARPPPPPPPPPLTSPDVRGEGHQEAEPGAAGPPERRCRAPRHPGAHPSPGRRGLGGRLRRPRSARHLPRRLRPGRQGSSRHPPAARLAAAAPRQWSGAGAGQERGRRERSTWAALRPLGPSALRISNPCSPGDCPTGD